MRIYLIRHSMTAGNLKRRYIGKTDEPLCPEGEALLKKRQGRAAYPGADRIFVSPMGRCIQTAQILYPGRELTVIEELSECDFGQFENKNYEELKDLPEYQRWIDSGGAMGFPGGESKESFSERSLAGFERALKLCGVPCSACGIGQHSASKEPYGCRHLSGAGAASAAFIVHGGTVMSIMEKYARPKGAYYDFQIGNGDGYELIMEDGVPVRGGLCPGPAAGGSGVAVPPGAAYGASGHTDGKNYKKLFA